MRTGRYGQGATLITSQLPTDTWHEVIGEPTFADAILDRLVHNAYRLVLDRRNLRQVTRKRMKASARGGLHAFKTDAKSLRR